MVNLILLYTVNTGAIIRQVMLLSPRAALYLNSPLQRCIHRWTPSGA